jgi:zinc protease
MSRRVLPAVPSLFAALTLAAPCLGQALPTDPALVTGQLANGMSYVVRRHAYPPGRAAMWLHIDSGSLNETDRQRGLAHYLEHLAFNGSENFPPGSLVPYFQSLGMTFGRDQNAFTNFDQTTYQLSLPDTAPETIGKGMTYFADVLYRLSLLPSEIDAERQIIQEERRRGLSGRQRVSDYIQERIAPGSLYSMRDPIGTEATIDSVNEADFRDYYGKWYVAPNATLIVIADTDAAGVVKLIEEKFGAAPKKPRPVPQPAGVRAYDQSFAIVASDPEIRSEEISIVRMEPARPPVTTVALYRDELVGRVAAAAMNRRLADKVSRGGTSYVSARVGLSNAYKALYNAEISGRANPGRWQGALEELALELQRARLYGFTAREIEDVNKEMIASAERAVETEATTQAQAFAARINANVAAGEPTLSAAQRLELLRQLLPSISLEEASRRFAAEFDPAAVAFVATLPSGPDVPSESRLLEIGRAALAVRPEPEEETLGPSQLMDEAPTPGTVAEGAEHAPSRVWSGWLANNVRVHHRFMDERKNDVSAQIALIGGELLETADNRGITSAAQLAWSRPATATLSSTDIREIMTGRKVNVGGGGFGGGRGGRGRGGGAAGGSDSIALSISGSPDDLEIGFQLAWLLLTEPRIEEAAFEQFKTTARQGIEESLRNPMSLGMRTVASAVYPEDAARTQPLTVEQLDSLTLLAAQAWLEKLIAQSPIEVVIVGDIARERALDLAARYLGALPSRERPAPGTYAALRALKRPAGPRHIERAADTATKQAFVFSGFYGADETNRADARALSMASRVLSTRMVKQVREEAQLVYSISSSSLPASTYPGFGVFSAGAPTDPAKVPALVEKLASMYEAFAAEGPTEEELEVAKKQFANTFDEQMKDPQFWSGRLARITFRGTSLDDIVEDPAAYQALSAAEVKAAFAKYYGTPNSIVVVVEPAEGASAPAPGGD